MIRRFLDFIAPFEGALFAYAICCLCAVVATCYWKP